MSRRRKQLVTNTAETAQLRALVANQIQMNDYLLSRLEFANQMGVSHGGQRDLYEVFGYKRHLRWPDYFAMYERCGAAAVVVDAMPDTCWQEHPLVYEDTGKGTLPGKNRDFTPFERDAAALVERLNLYSDLHNADRLSRIGECAGVLIGVSVRKYGPLDRALKDNALSGPDDVLYLTPFHQGRITQIDWVTQPDNPNFGAPEYYHIDLGGDDPQAPATERVRKVHASRVLHVAENTIDNPWLAIPELKGVYNYLENIEKIVGGGSEAFWQFAKKMIVLEVSENVRPPDMTAVEDKLALASHHQLSALVVQGGQVKTLPVVIPDPSASYNVNLSVICARTRIPKRKFVGSERGELASSQDDKNWNQECLTRNTNYTGPKVVLRFFQRMIVLGACAPNAKSLRCYWKDLTALSPVERAQIGKTKIDGLVAYSNSPGASGNVPRQEMRVEFLDLDPEPSVDAVKDQEEFDKEQEEAAAAQQPAVPDQVPPQDQEGQGDATLKEAA